MKALQKCDQLLLHECAGEAQEIDEEVWLKGTFISTEQQFIYIFIKRLF